MKRDDQIRIWEAFNILSDVLEGLLPELKDIIKVRWQLNAIMNSWSERTVNDVIRESTIGNCKKESE